MAETGLKIPSNFLDYLGRSEYTKASVYEKIMEGTEAERGAAGFEEVSSEGLVARWSMDGVPEIPDDPAGVTYLQDDWATVDGWFVQGFVSGTVTVSGGKMIFAKGAASEYARKTFAFASGSTVKIKVRVASGSPSSNILTTSYTSGSITTTPIDISGNWTTISTIPVVTAERLGIWLGSFSGSELYTLEIDFIYIGTGAYLPNSLIDNSGNGNHGTIYGATPVEGISGRALAFDGVNDNCIIAGLSSYFGVGKVVAVSGWFTPKSAAGTQMFSYPDSANNNRFYISILNASTVNFSANNNISVAIPLATNERAFLVCIRDNVTGILYAYKNGIFVGQATSTPPTVLGVLSVYLGSINATGGYANCEIDEPRIYNRAPTSEEVYSLYMSKGRGPDCQVKSVTPIKDSIVVRDTVGNIQANGFKFPGTQVVSTDPNTLDDYEEGTFTPILQFGGASVGLTLSTQVGSYTKIGREVSYMIFLILSSKGSSTGSATISGLPFASAAMNFQPAAIYTTTVSFADFIAAYAGASSTSITLHEIVNAGTVTAIADTDFSNTSNVRISGKYYV